MTYKYAIDFEPTDLITVSTFELFYHTGKIYNNLILPVPFAEVNSKSMQEDFSSYSGGTIGTVATHGTNKSDSTFME